MILSQIAPDSHLGFAAILAMIPGALLLIYILVYWVRYPWIGKWFSKWSREEFEVPAKRFNKLLFHGIGVYASFLPALAVCMLLMKLDIHSTFFSIVMLVLTLAAYAASVWGYWWLVKYFHNRQGEAYSGRHCAWEIAYGFFSLLAWCAIVVLAFYAVMLAVVVVVGYFLLKLILFFCFSEEITVKKGGLFGGTKKVWASRNLDGSYTDAEGKTYKKDNSFF